MVTAKGNGYLLDDDGAYHVITTAADDATTALSKERPRVVVKGTGINHIFTTPSAASLTRAHFVISNWSSEFVGVMNSDSTLWIRIMPSQTAVVFLTAGGTAAGVWGAELSPIHPDYGFCEHDDFVAGNSIAGYSKLGLLPAGNGTGSGVSTAWTYIGNQGCHGRSLITGSTDAGYYGMYTNMTGIIFGGMCYAFELHRSRLADLSTAGEEFSVDFGFGDSVTNSEHTDAVLLRYKRTTSTEWLRVKNDGGGGVVETASGIAVVEDANLNLRVEVASDASRADFWVNRVHAGSETTGLPGVADYIGHVWKIVKTAGTTARTWTADGMTVAFGKPTRRA
jgi:hypothetical protein